MNNLFDLLFGLGHTPIRREVSVRITLDDEGHQRVEPVDGEAFMLSEEGSIDKIRFTQPRFYHCGCAVESSRIGGQCANRSCRQISCIKHHGRCAACSKPQCLECSRYLADAEQGEVRLCPRCHETLSRQLVRRKITRALLSPFIG